MYAFPLLLGICRYLIFILCSETLYLFWGLCVRNVHPFDFCFWFSVAPVAFLFASTLVTLILIEIIRIPYRVSGCEVDLCEST